MKTLLGIAVVAMIFSISAVADEDGRWLPDLGVSFPNAAVMGSNGVTLVAKCDQVSDPVYLRFIFLEKIPALPAVGELHPLLAYFGDQSIGTKAFTAIVTGNDALDMPPSGRLNSPIDVSGAEEFLLDLVGAKRADISVPEPSLNQNFEFAIPNLDGQKAIQELYEECAGSRPWRPY